MRKRIATWSIVFISMLGCGTIVSNFPRSIDVIELENGVKITIELNENIMSIRDPEVTKILTINYGKREKIYRTTDDHYDFDLLLMRRTNDTAWVVLEDGWYEAAECSFSNEDDTFQERYFTLPKDPPQDTLLKIKYKDFTFRVE